MIAEPRAETTSLPVRCSRRRLPLWKRVLFSAITLGLTLLGMEGIARWLTPWPWDQLYQWQEAVAASGKGAGTAQEVLHPYLGWTLSPETDPGTDIDGEHIPVNRWGFLDQRDSVQKRSIDRVIIAVTGGSVAQDFSFRGERRLKELLAADSRFAGREIIVVHLAASGYKQPQQLILLNYLSALGAEFDYVLNMDGFNDVVLAHSDNARRGLHYAYPYYWHARLHDVVDPRETSVSFRLFERRARRQSLATSAVNSPLRGSMLYCLFWKFRDLRLMGLVNDLALEIVDNNPTSGRGYSISGPRLDFDPSDDEAARTAVVNLWKHCSWQMAALCHSQGTCYLHFLQPNQYVPDSKPLTSEEMEKAFDPEHELRRFVAANYPAMVAAKPWFDEHGVRFFDLTGIFREESRTVYRDWCCHVNQLGNDLLAEAVAAAILCLPNE